MSRKSKRKELRLQDDEFVNAFSRLVQYAREHRERLSYVLIGIAVVLAVVTLGMYHRQSLRAEAVEILNDGWNAYLKTDQAPAEVPEGEPDPRLENLAKAAEAFEQVAEEYGSTPYAMQAQYLLAVTRFESGDAEGALEAFSRYGERFPQGPMVRACEYGKAACMSDLDRRQEAIQILQALGTETGSGDQELLEMELARLHRLEGHQQEALELYRKIYLRDPDGQWGKSARSWIYRMGESPPEPAQG